MVPIPTAASRVPGFSVHDALWELVRGGLTPLEALQAATRNPAEYFQATDSLGRMAPGQLADFVLLDANPLQDIYNTRRIRAVVANGRFFDRGELDALLAEARQMARGNTPHGNP
jgi:imidazolonepropionase-like amidohydrolase